MASSLGSDISLPGQRCTTGPGTSDSESPDETPTAVPISALLPADSPREAREHPDHIEILAEAQTPLPPILVHRTSMQVIDGMHRLRAAQRRGDELISAIFFDGSPVEAFVLAVKSNVTHGMPLTLAERKQAARRILASHPRWSDRSIAVTTGLSHKTVGAIRREVAGESTHSTVRRGTDGRDFPVSTVEGRRRTCEILKSNPDATVNELARAAGISESTVKDVRRRLRQHEDPIPPRLRQTNPPVEQRQPARAPLSASWRGDPQACLNILKNDPSVSSSQTGRALLRYLDLHLQFSRRWETITGDLPQHCHGVLSEIAKAFVGDWDRMSKVEAQVAK